MGIFTFGVLANDYEEALFSITIHIEQGVRE